VSIDNHNGLKAIFDLFVVIVGLYKPVHAVIVAVLYTAHVNPADPRGYLCTPMVAIPIGKVYI
jgi:hypothetical protein